MMQLSPKSNGQSITCSVIIPVYNSALSLPALLERLSQVLPGFAAEYEAVLVNDCSRDNSWDVICNLVTIYPWIVAINLMRNYGQHNALLCGIRSAQYEFSVTMDDDLQHPPSEIAKLLEKLQEGYDVVYGAPEEMQHGPLRDLASTITKLVLQSAMGADSARHASAFRAFRTPLREAFSTYQSPFVSIDVLLTWGTTRFAAIKVHHDQRRFGKSNYNLRKLLIHAINMMTGFTVWPLQAASTLGFSFTIFGILVFLFVIGRYLIEGGSIPGFPFLASIISIFSGVQLFSLGVIGEYLARMHFRLMDRPAYTIRSKIDPQAEQQVAKDKRS